MNRKEIHILLVEGSELDVATISEVLTSDASMKLTVAQSLAAARACLAVATPDLAIINLSLPDGRGSELLPATKAEAIYPILIMTGPEDVDAAVECVNGGALDYVITSTANLADMPRIVERTQREWLLIEKYKQAKQELAAVKEQLKTGIGKRQKAEEERDRLFEHSVDMFAVAQVNGYFKQLNPAWTKTLGWTEQELLSCPYIDFVHPDDQADTLAGAERLLDRREVRDYENRCRCKDGTYRWLSWNAFMLPEEGLTFTVARDITERKRAEQELRERELQYHAFFEANHSVMLLIDPVTAIIVDANPAACSFYGYSKEELIHKKITDINTLHQDQVFLENERAKGEQRQYFNFKHQLAGGAVRDVEVFSGPITVGGKNLLYSIVHDISKRKQAEEALRKSEARLKATHKNVAAGIVVLDARGRYVEVNEKYEAMLGYSKAEIVGKNPFEITFPEDRERSDAKLNSLISGEVDSYRHEKRYVRKDGSIFWADFSATRILNEHGKLEAVAGVFIDISERKAIEERLREANRELDAFVYTVSHDLRSPLTPIIGYAEYLKDQYREQLDDNARGLLDTIMEQGNRMMLMMEDLLTLAKVGYLEKPARPVDVKGAIHKVIDERKSQLVEAGLNVKLGELSSAYIPENLLIEVFDNLIGNAIRYASERGTSIIVEEEPSEGKVRFSVRDHGPGIHAEECNRIFEAFYRGSTGKKVHGTGIGLAIVRKIAQLFGGRAWVEDAPDGGSIFWVEMDNVPPFGDDPAIP